MSIFKTISFLASFVFVVSLSFGQVDTTPPLANVDWLEKSEKTMALFPGCEKILAYSDKKKCAEQKMMTYIYGELKYPKQALRKKIQGTVIISFYIDVQGRLVNLRAINKIGGGCEEEALRVFEKIAALPEKWTAATSQGEPVISKYNIPVRFYLK